MKIAAGAFKARCLQLMDEVAQTGRDVIITKRGRPVARLVPIANAEPAGLYGCMRATVLVTADIVAPLEDPWEADDGGGP
jgi:prevent-host-death family protein